MCPFPPPPQDELTLWPCPKFCNWPSLPQSYLSVFFFEDFWGIIAPTDLLYCRTKRRARRREGRSREKAQTLTRSCSPNVMVITSVNMPIWWNDQSNEAKPIQKQCEAPRLVLGCINYIWGMKLQILRLSYYSSQDLGFSITREIVWTQWQASFEVSVRILHLLQFIQWLHATSQDAIIHGAGKEELNRGFSFKAQKRPVCDRSCKCIVNPTFYMALATFYPSYKVQLVLGQMVRLRKCTGLPLTNDILQRCQINLMLLLDADVNRAKFQKDIWWCYMLFFLHLIRIQ